jgi:hypothetical protein
VKREAKQFAFMLAGVILGATVLFIVGMEVGRRADVSFLDEGKAGLEGATAALGKTNASASTDYSFFEELESPVEPKKLRKLAPNFANANNTPEVEAGLKKRRDRIDGFNERKLARKKATGEFEADGNHGALSVKRLTRKPIDSDEATEDLVDDAPDDARDLMAKPAEKLRTLSRGLTTASAEPKSHGRAYTLQLGVYRSEDDAERLVDNLRAQGHSPRMTRSTVAGKGEVFRVRMGRFESIAAADQGRSEAALAGHRAMVTPL